MARVQYQRSARPSGYRPQQADLTNLQRLREEGDRRLQGMRNVAQAEIDNRREVLEAMKADEAYTARAEQRNFEIATQNEQRTIQGLQAQAQRDQQQFNADADARAGIFKSIQSMSKTAGDAATKIYEQARRDTFNSEVNKGFSAENSMAKAVQQQALAETDVAMGNSRREFLAKGGDPVVARENAAQSDALAVDFTEGQIAAYWRWHYADDRNAYLKQKSDELQRALTPEEEQYFTGEFRQKVISIQGEQTGFAAKLIAPYVQQYGNQADANKFAETRRKRQKIAEERVLEMSKTNVANAAPQELQRVLGTSFYAMEEVVGRSKAWDNVDDIFKRQDPRTGKFLQDEEALGNYVITLDNGKKVLYKDHFKNTRWPALLAARDKLELQFRKQVEDTNKVARVEKANDLIRALPDDYTQEDLDGAATAYNEMFPGYTDPRFATLGKKFTVDAKTRANEVKRIMAKNDWELTERDQQIIDVYGSATQKATFKQRYEQGNGSIYSKEVDNIVKQGQSIITGKNNYSDLAKTGSMPAAIYFDRSVRSRIRQLLAGGEVAGNTPTERAENAANIAVEEEQEKVRKGHKEGIGAYKIKTFRNGRVEYPLIKKALGNLSAIEEQQRRIESMRDDIIKGGAAAFVNNPDSIFTDERMEALMQDPNLPPNGFEIATAKALGISQHSLRNLGAKAKGFKFNFKDTLLEGTGVAYTPELAKTMSKLSRPAQKATLDSRMGNTQNFQNLGVHGRPGMSQQLAQFIGVPVEQTKEYPIILENGQPIRIAYGPASQAFDRMLAAGFPTEGITNVFRDKAEYERLIAEGYEPSATSYHNLGLAIDAHGVSLLWLKKYGAQYGWVHEPGYVGHGGHFIFKPSI